jgi:Tryptophan synthase alpha chain
VQLADALRASRAHRSTAVVPYVLVDRSRLSRLRITVRALKEGGATALELGFPFSDPIADGPVLEAASGRALAHGTGWRDLLRASRRWRLGAHRTGPFARGGVAVDSRVQRGPPLPRASGRAGELSRSDAYVGARESRVPLPGLPIRHHGGRRSGPLRRPETDRSNGPPRGPAPSGPRRVRGPRPRERSSRARDGSGRRRRRHRDRGAARIEPDGREDLEVRSSDRDRALAGRNLTRSPPARI